VSDQAARRAVFRRAALGDGEEDEPRAEEPEGADEDLEERPRGQT
jgi:hypothetical protein